MQACYTAHTLQPPASLSNDSSHLLAISSQGTKGLGGFGIGTSALWLTCSCQQMLLVPGMQQSPLNEVCFCLSLRTLTIAFSPSEMEP